MSINPNVWGDSDNWIPLQLKSDSKLFDNKFDSSIKIADFLKIADKDRYEYYGNYSGGYEMANGVYFGLLDVTQGQMDVSISPWNINSKSILFNPKIVSYDETTEEFILIDVYSGNNKMILSGGLSDYVYLNENNSKVIQPGEYRPCNFDNIFSFGDVTKEDFLNARNISVVGYYLQDYYLRNYFVTDFNYREILIVGYIVASNQIEIGTDWTQICQPIDEYYKEGYKTHPYINYITYAKYTIDKLTNKYENFDSAFELINCGYLNAKGYTISSNYMRSYSPENLDNIINGYHLYNVPASSIAYRNYNTNHLFNPLGSFVEDGFILQPTAVMNIDERFTLKIRDRVTMPTQSRQLFEVYPFIHYGLLNKNDVLREISYLGFWFTDSQQGIIDANQNKFGESDKLFLPEFDGSNTTTGGFFYGSEAKKQNNFNWTDNIVDESSPKNQEDSGDLDTKINSNSIGGSRNLYFLSNSEFDNLVQFLNGWDGDIETDFKGTNPIDYIQSVIFYPFQPKTISWNDKELNIGPVSTGITAPSTPQTYGMSYSYNYFLKPFFNDFRDYAPYTNITLYTIAGSVELDSKTYINHNIKCEFYLDFVGGTVACLIFRDNLLMDVIHGNFGVKIPLTGYNFGSYQNAEANLQAASDKSSSNMLSSILSIGGGIGLTALGAYAGNPVLMLGGVTSAASGMTNFFSSTADKTNADYQLEHNAPTLGKTGTTSTVNNLLQQYTPKIVITRVSSMEYDPEVYGKTVGYACNANGKVKDFSGFTVAYNIDTSGLALTLTEQQMIKQLFNNGVYL